MMPHEQMSVNLWEKLKKSAPTLLRRAALAGSTAGSLALVGGQTVTRSHAATGLDLASRVGSTEPFPLSLATGFIVAVRHTVQGWSDGSTEVVSLLVLGVGLIGAGQALAAAKRRKQQADDAQHAVNTEERTFLNAQSLAEFREALDRRAAR
jgi:hypothetical protein